jgi:hypothetical protein
VFHINYSSAKNKPLLLGTRAFYTALNLNSKSSKYRGPYKRQRYLTTVTFIFIMWAVQLMVTFVGSWNALSTPEAIKLILSTVI